MKIGLACKQISKAMTSDLSNTDFRRIDKKWRRWGPYLSNRQWGTVREQYNLGPLRWGDNNNCDEAWHNLRYHEASGVAYQFGEDGILGISDEDQYLCFAVGFWNHANHESPPNCYDVIKERLFGLSGLFGAGREDGSHGEDVKELYYYTHNDPWHRYMRGLYKYPCQAYPHKELIENNAIHKDSKINCEYELLDTDALLEDGYFDISVEYAKQEWNIIAVKITATNRSNREQELSILPTLFFRNTWTWGQTSKKPNISIDQSQSMEETSNKKTINASYNNNHLQYANPWHLWSDSFDCSSTIIFTDNETNPILLSPDNGHLIKENLPSNTSISRYKDGISQYIINDHHGDNLIDTVSGTKCSIAYRRTLAAGESWSIYLRLHEAVDGAQEGPSTATSVSIAELDRIIQKCKEECRGFYEQRVFPDSTDDSRRLILRQALSGILWSKQFYHFNVSKWMFYRSLFHDESSNETMINHALNQDWQHVGGPKIMIVPDKWEYPYFCSWDSAFHAITIALVDPEFAKDQLRQLGEPDFMRFNGQIPGCEFEFSDVNPPVHAWAVWKLFEMDQKKDDHFLEEMIWKLWKNFTWWKKHRKIKREFIEKNRPSVDDSCSYYKGGFMGLDNISIVDRNHFIGETVFIEQVDSTAWMGFFALYMIKIAVALGETDSRADNQSYITIATECLQEFLNVEKTLNTIDSPRFEPSWNMDDYWYYDILRIQLDSFKLDLPLRVRSIAGIIPMFATDVVSGNKEKNKVLAAIWQSLESSSHRQATLQDHARLVPRHDNNPADTIELCLVNQKKFLNMTDRILNEHEFLSDYGIRSLSKFHQEHPFILDGVLENKYGQARPIEVKYEPGCVNSSVFGGNNSNWTGPVWMPLNYLMIEMLRNRSKFSEETSIQRSVPTIGSSRKTYRQIANDISERLIKLFSAHPKLNVRPCHFQNDRSAKFYRDDQDQSGTRNENDPSELLLFYEYFNAETGAGLGASHQSWTTLIANIIHEFDHREM